MRNGRRCPDLSGELEMKLLFFHGLESGPHGSKFQTLSKHFEIESPDFQNLALEERVAKAEALTEGEDDLVVVGSSFGGLVASILYDKHPERFRGYVLMAPALHHLEPKSMPERCAVIHGNADEIVPFEDVKRICAKFGAPFFEVDDEHRLANSHELMVAKVREILA